MPRRAPSPELIERFRTSTDALTGGTLPLGLAVSGGPDSLALLLLAAAAYPGRVRAATVDHGLRAESAAEAAFVGQVCRSLDVPHATLKADVDTGRASLQQAAREARYAALDRWLRAEAIPTLATAHHVEDQAETLLMRLQRGAGAGGLSGIRARARLPVPASEAILIRPLLAWRRGELRAIVDAAGLTPVDDPSNRDLRYDRARIRQAMAETQWLDPVAIANSAAALADADEALDWAAARAEAERVAPDGRGLSFAAGGLPDEIKRRLIAAIIARLDPQAGRPRGKDIGRLLATLETGGTATLAGIKCTGGSPWRFEPAPPRRRSR